MIVIGDVRGINERGGSGVSHVGEWAAGSVEKRKERKRRKIRFE